MMISALLKCGKEGFGFTVEGSCPCKLNVLAKGVAAYNGLKTGDILVAIDGTNLEAADHFKVVNFFRRAIKKKEMLITFRHCNMRNEEVSMPKPHYQKSRKSMKVDSVYSNQVAGSSSSSNCQSDWFGTLRRTRARVSLFGDNARDKTSANNNGLSESSHNARIISTPTVALRRRSTKRQSLFVEPIKPALPQQIHLIGDEEDCDIVAVFVVQFLGKAAFQTNTDPSLTVDKALTGVSHHVIQYAVLRIYETKLMLSLDESPFFVTLPYQSIVQAAHSRTNFAVFGVISYESDECDNYLCYVFSVDEHFAEHFRHKAFAVDHQIKCRQNKDFDCKTTCAQFPSNCYDIISSINYILEDYSQPAAKSTKRCSSFSKMQNTTVAKFLQQFSKQEKAENPSDLTLQTNQINIQQADDDCPTIIDFSNSSSNDEDVLQQKSDYVEMRALPRLKSPLVLPRLESPLSKSTSIKEKLKPEAKRFCGNPARACSPTASCSSSKKGVFTTSTQQSVKKRRVTATQIAEAAQHRIQQLQQIRRRRRSNSLLPTAPTISQPSGSSIESTEGICDNNNSNRKPIGKLANAQPSHPSKGQQQQFDRHHSSASSAGGAVPTEQAVISEVCEDLDTYKGSRKSKRGNRHFTKDTSPSSSSSDCCVVPKKSVDKEKENRRPEDQRSAQHHSMPSSNPGAGTLLDKTDIEQVLKNEAARAPFQQFLQQQFCAENINFYLAVEEYRCIPESEPDRRTDFGRQIFDRHFASNCIEPVNIDNSTANSIRDAYKKNKFGPELYDVVQYQIFHLLKYDCWPRYLRAGGQCSEDLGGDGSGRAHADSIASTSGKYSGTGAANEFCVGEKRSGRKSLFRFLRRHKDSEVEFAVSVDEMDNPHSDLPKRTKHEESCSIVDYAPSSSCCSSSQKSLETREFSQNHDSDVENNRRISNSSSDCPEVDQCSMKKTFRNKNFGEIGPGAGKSSREPQADFPLRTCTLLCADVASEISLFDQLQSVKQWAASIAETHGLDKNATEVVDAQTGSTIDPARQAVDALNNRTVRIMPVVKFPVVFLASSSASKPSPPIPAKVIILRARVALTVGKTIRPIMSKYNVDPDQAIVCISGTCEMVKLSTPINSIYQKSLTVLSEQQFSERKSIPKKEYQKELVLVPTWMTSSNPDPGLPFHQHGDVGFYEVSIEAEGKGLKQYATRSNSSNPREFFKFGRKPSQAKATRGGIGGEAETLNVGSPNETSSAFSSHLRNPNFGRGSDRRKSVGSTASPSAGPATTSKPNSHQATSSGHSTGAALAVGLVAPADIPYCGENEPDTASDANYPSSTIKHEALYPTKSAIPSSFTSGSSFDKARQSLCYELPDFLKQNDNIPSSTAQIHSVGSNGSMPCVPAIYASAVRSIDKDSAMTPTDDAMDSGLTWQKADYV